MISLATRATRRALRMSEQHSTVAELRADRPIDDALLATLVEELAPRFGGELIDPASPGYDEARTVWNAMVDKRPSLIARCTRTEDVVAVVDAARRHGLAPSIRGGGH